jgi:hypothetical protein
MYSLALHAANEIADFRIHHSVCMANVCAALFQFLPVWTRRWFVLESHALKWYRSEHALAKESGVIPLASVSEVRVFERSKDGGTSLVVHSSCRPLLLRAEDAGKADTWARAIQQQIQLVNKRQVRVESKHVVEGGK